MREREGGGEGVREKGTMRRRDERGGGEREIEIDR